MKIRVNNVTGVFGTATPDDLDYYVGLTVTIGREQYPVGVAVGIPESQQGSARASGAYERYGRGASAWWVDLDDWGSLPKDTADAVLDELSANASRLFRQARSIVSGTKPKKKSTRARPAAKKAAKKRATRRSNGNGKSPEGKRGEKSLNAALKAAIK